MRSCSSGMMSDEEETAAAIKFDTIIHTKRKRRRPTSCRIAILAIAILLLLTLTLCNSSNNSCTYVTALISPSLLSTSSRHSSSPPPSYQQSNNRKVKIWGIQQQQQNMLTSYKSNAHSSSSTTAMLFSTVADQSTTSTTPIKGQISPSSSSTSTKKIKVKQQQRGGNNKKSKKQRSNNFRKRKTYKNKKSSSRIISNNNRKSKSLSTTPWNADYTTSLRTQKRIQASARGLPNGSSNVHIANNVLQTLLSTSPLECNAANIVCALTLSSKVLTTNTRRGGSSNNRSTSASSVSDEQQSTATVAFQQSLKETLSILQTLISENKLSPRQLCNAAWGLAKHVEYSPYSLYTKQRDGNSIVVIDNKSSAKTSWDLTQQLLDISSDEKGDEEEEGMGMEGLIEEVLNLIALRVVEHLEATRFESFPRHQQQQQVGGGKKTNKNQANKRYVQPGELSMLLWSYAVVKPRDCPPGWEIPRRVEKLLSTNEEEKSIDSSGAGGSDEEEDIDFVTFVELDDNDVYSSSLSSTKSSPKREVSDERSITSKLFDAAAIAFCQGEGAAVQSTTDDKASSTTLLKSCTWSELSNIAWSYATRGAYRTKEGEAMMSFFAKEATRRIHYCGSIGSGGGSGGGGKDDVCNILPRDVIQIAWALGTMESDNVSVNGDALVLLVDAIDTYWIYRENDRPLAKWTCADLVQMATALAHGRLDNQDVLMAVYQESLRRLHGTIDAATKGQQSKMKGFSTAEISILLWVQARLYLTPKFGDVYGAFPSTASRALMLRMEPQGNNSEHGTLLPASRMQQRGLAPQEQANLAWSLTVLENYDDNVVTLLQNIFHAASSNDEGIIQLEHAHQLWQSYFLLSKDCPEAVKYVPEKFSQYLEEKWNIEKSRSKTSSSRHRAISQTLDLMKVAHRNEYDEDVDVAIVLDEDSAWTHTAVADFSCFDGFDNSINSKLYTKVAVEFDGPHHFTVMASTAEDLELIAYGEKIQPRVLGHTVLKYRLLKKKGWTVVRIPYYEFDKIPFWASMVSFVS